MNIIKQSKNLFFQLCILTAAALPTVVCADSNNATPTPRPGQVSFLDLSQYYGEPQVEINLNKVLMGMVSGLSRQSDPEVADILSKLEFIQVRVYKIKGDATQAVEALNTVEASIKKDQWLKIVTVNEDNQQVRIFSHMGGEKIDGVVVMVVDSGSTPKEAVFINIVGEIDPEKISKVTQSLNLDVM